MKKLAIAAMLIMSLPVVAYPQDKGPPTARSDKEKKEDEAIEKAYQETVKRDRDNRSPAKSDPWQSVRPSSSDNTKH
jgi:hypothetical protein